MTELSAVLQTFVDQPLSAPPPVEEVIARSRRMRARRRQLRAGALVVVAAIVVGLGTLSDNDADDATVVLGGGDVQEATYVATAAGGYEGEGTWSLTIVRDGRTVRYTSGTSPACGDLGTIQPGDEVRGEIRGSTSLLRVGEAAHC